MRRPCVRRLPPAAPAPSGSSGPRRVARTLVTRFVSADPESVDAWTADLRSLQADTTDGEIVSVRCDITDRTRRQWKISPATVPTRTTSLHPPRRRHLTKISACISRCATVRRLMTPSPAGAGGRTARGPETAPWIARHLQRARASGPGSDGGVLHARQDDPLRQREDRYREVRGGQEQLELPLLIVSTAAEQEERGTDV